MTVPTSEQLQAEEVITRLVGIMPVFAGDDATFSYGEYGNTISQRIGAYPARELSKRLCATVDAIRELSQALLRERAQHQWQDIATAPKDGTTVVLARGGKVEHGSWSDAKLPEREGGVEIEFGLPEGWYGYESFSPIEPDEQPTHWMPLPAPPVAEPEGT